MEGRMTFHLFVSMLWLGILLLTFEIESHMIFYFLLYFWDRKMYVFPSFRFHRLPRQEIGSQTLRECLKTCQNRNGWANLLDDQITTNLPNPPWYPMVENPTILASASENRTTKETWLAANLEWHFLSPAKWLLMAHATSWISTLETGLSLFSPVAERRHVGTFEPSLTWKGSSIFLQKASGKCFHFG